MLFIVSTPIGNMEDITLRALRVLREADYVAAEDTRHSGMLLKKFEISTPMLSFHSHSDRSRLEHIIRLLKEGKNIALISDAGTPGVSDPGFLLISTAVSAGIPVSPVPGASALLAALTGSGLPMDKFVFLGFLPLKKGRQTLFQTFQTEKRTVVFFESPLRLVRTLRQLATSVGGTTQCVVARELTKIHEEYIRGTFDEVISELESRKKIQGECVVLFSRTFLPS